MSHLSYLEAIVVGAFQGVAELFPVSSLGHSILVPALVGGSWARDLNVAAPRSPYLAFIVGLHVATAAALLVFFWRDWIAIIRGFVTSIVHRRIEEPYERLAWLIVAGTVPVGLAGLLLDHVFRTTLGRPIPAAAFLVVNGGVLYTGERLRRRADARREQPRHQSVAVGAGAAGGSGPALTMGDVAAHGGGDSDLGLARLPVLTATGIGAAQIFALLPGISRSGSTMVVGLLKGLTHDEAARFSFLLATPVIFAAGALKIPDLTGAEGAGIHGQVLAGSVASFVSAWIAVKYLTRYFRTRTLTPFAIYSVVLGLGSLIWLSV